MGHTTSFVDSFPVALPQAPCTLPQWEPNDSHGAEGYKKKPTKSTCLQAFFFFVVLCKDQTSALSELMAFN